MTTDGIGHSIKESTALHVARKILGDSTLPYVGKYKVEDLAAEHGDQRTVAILKVSGEAPAHGTPRDWSAIVKAIDPTKRPNTGTEWVHPELEEQIYAGNLLTHTGVPFRAAECYCVEETESGHRLLWLEDLTAAAQHPWNTAQYLLAAYNLGRFNGHYLDPDRIPAGIGLPRNNFAPRWEAMHITELLPLFAEHADSETVRKVFTKSQTRTVIAAADHVASFIRHASSLPTGLAHGDSHDRNLFLVGDGTVAIDWAGVSQEPLGADVGCLIGAALTRGIDEAQMVLENADHIYSRYVEGLIDSGWSGDRVAVRTGFFAQIGMHLNILATLPASLHVGRYEVHREYIEARTGTKLEALPDRLRPIAPVITEYLEEFQSLAG